MKNYVTPEVLVSNFDEEIRTDIISASAITENHEKTDSFNQGWLS